MLKTVTIEAIAIWATINALCGFQRCLGKGTMPMDSFNAPMTLRRIICNAGAGPSVEK